MIRIFILLAAVLVVVRSCNLGPNYTTPPAKVADRWTQNSVTPTWPVTSGDTHRWRYLIGINRDHLFVCIRGVVPTGAGVTKSLGIAVAPGMPASTFPVVLFVPSFYVVLQRFAERKGPKASEGRPEKEAPALVT